MREQSADDHERLQMTKISEQVFSVEVPGHWEPVEAREEGVLAYRQIGGPGTLEVVLLRMRPVFAIADKARLLSDYASHRQKFERGRVPSLEQSEPVFDTPEGRFEAHWNASDDTSGRMRRHRAILVDDILVDFCFETAGSAGDSFDARAEEVLSTAEVFGEPGRQEPGA